MVASDTSQARARELPFQFEGEREQSDPFSEALRRMPPAPR
jgi:hypothetical protein